jgi:hypothetical protein
MPKTTIRMTPALVALAILASGIAHAQTQAQSHPAADPAKARAELDKSIELVRKDIRSEKADILGKTMALDSTQAAAFWPIYKAYEAERQTLGDERLAIIQDLAEHFDSLNDAKAKGLLERQLAYEDKKLALTKKYKDEMLKVLPAKTVARFFQVDSRLNNLIDLKIASEIPLVY